MPLMSRCWCFALLLFALSVDAIRTRSNLRAKHSIAPSFLIMSSPTERKVSYGMVVGHQAANKIIKPLVDAGLVGPFGIALDVERVWLYVADPVQHKIFHYKLKVEEHIDTDTDTSNFTLAVDGYPTCVAQDISATWITVDQQGNLYFSVEDTPPSIDKLSLNVIEQLVSGSIAASSLLVRTDRETDADAALDGQLASGNGADYSTPEPIITRLYEEAGEDSQEGKCPVHLSTPGGLVTNGKDIWWTNQKNGYTDGSVVHGKATVQPSATSGVEASSHCTHVLANQTAVAYGLVVTNNLLIYTSGKIVYATSRTNGITKMLSSEVFNTRGLAWDGANTLFVADREGNCILSLPCGQLREHAPLDVIFDFHDPFGVALLTGHQASKVTQTIVSGDGATVVSGIKQSFQSIEDLFR
mmetsp:Transcript_147142/g.256827  ORF Transcript_147142/g.256827 Transcript_147142/m.256827 type:complete len:414 (+) Transcript_147142:132-1373(+)